MTYPYKGRDFALLTKHGKELIIAPILRERLGAKLVLATGYDTDLLGTFSTEVQRTLSPQACALRKAQLACELSGLSIGLGSEGSFTIGLMGLMTINAEVLCCFNADENWHITGVSVGPSAAQGRECNSEKELADFLGTVPAQQRLVLQSHGRIAKGLESPAEVKATVSAWSVAGSTYPLSINYDLRAHFCPERRDRIALAAENLMQRLLSLCPQCSRPGFWPDKRELGLPCKVCSSPTSALKEKSASCERCCYEKVYPVTEVWGDPSQCFECNP